MEATFKITKIKGLQFRMEIDVHDGYYVDGIKSIRRLKVSDALKDAMISAYVLTHITIPFDQPTAIKSEVKTKNGDPIPCQKIIWNHTSRLSEDGVWYHDLTIGLTLDVLLDGKPTNRTGKNNYTNLTLLVDSGRNIQYGIDTSRWLINRRIKFDRFIKCINRGYIVTSDDCIYDVIPDADLQNELRRFTTRRNNDIIKAHKRFMEETKGIKYYREIEREFNRSINRTDKIPQFQVDRHFKQNGDLGAKMMTSAQIAASIPCLDVFVEPIAAADFDTACYRMADNQYFYEVRDLALRTCISTLTCYYPCTSKDWKDRLILATSRLLTMIEEARSSFLYQFNKMSWFGQDGFILQNTCRLALETKTNIYQTYEKFDSRNDAYLTASELESGLQVLRRIAPWEYYRVTDKSK